MPDDAPKTSKTTSFYLPVELADRIEAEAVRQVRSASNLVTVGMTAYLDGNVDLLAQRDTLLEALKAYQAANRLHHDADAELFEMGRAAIAKCEGNK